MNKLYFASFLLGVTVGVYGAADYFKNKYRTFAEKEIDSVKNAFREEQRRQKVVERRKDEKSVNTLSEISSLIPDNLPARKEMETIIDENGYSPGPGPYIISPDDFGGTFEYECISLVYYADGVLVDDNQNVVTDIEGCIGEEALEHFGEYEDDAVHVRNDAKQCDYEVLLDTRKWSDVRQKWVR